MIKKPSEPILNLLINQRAEIIEVWISELMAIWGPHNDIDIRTIKQLGIRTLNSLLSIFSDYSKESIQTIQPDGMLALTIQEFSANRAKAGFKPANTMQFVTVLKNIITQRLMAQSNDNHENLATCFNILNEIFDLLSVFVFESYVETREKIITQQSQSLIELSTPVIRVWDQVLLLPLIGVIDTLRARQFTECLLDSIARYEASVTIIDITGVPTVDTSVARHIMKTMDAAQLLGTRIIMTGINPASALTLTKLGIGFEGVITRASLRAGIAEAFKVIGQRVVIVDGGGK